jgi:glyoxylase-like metal-dependent hydrolase (beta-lactamase superfamily II)
MTIEIITLTLGPVSTNCYIIGSTSSKEALIIDPVDDAPAILAAAQEREWTIKLILATHAHFDHVLASRELKDLTGAPFVLHKEAVPMLERLPETGLLYFGMKFPEAAKPDRLLGITRETITLGEVALETLYTPGHAPGHISYYMPAQHIVFSGDALFKGAVGRTDLPGGSHEVLMHSIRTMLLPLGDEVIVLSGHGGQTTIGHEKRTNPFLT